MRTGTRLARTWPTVAIILLIHGHPAHAQRVAVVVVAPPDAPLSADRARDLVAQAASAHGQEVVEQVFEYAAERVRAGAVPESELRVVAKARALMDQGWRAYLAADIELARVGLERAREQLEPALALPGVPRLYAELCLRLGAVEQHLGHDEPARAAFACAAALDPAREVDEIQFAPDVVQAYRTAHSAPPSVTMRVLARPASARLTIDDRDLGPAPVTVEVAPGPHLLVARHPGHRAHARFIHAGRDAADITVTLEHDAPALAVLRGADAVTAGRSQDQVASALAGLSAYAELDSTFFMASVWRANRPALIAQRCTAPPVRCTEVVEVRYPRTEASASAAEELWSRLMAASSFTHPPRIASEPALWPAHDHLWHLRHLRPPPVSTKRCRLCRNPWLWAGVGAALTTVGAVLLLSRPDRPAPVIIVDPCRFGPCTP